jgi:hypothetical protein
MTSTVNVSDDHTCLAPSRQLLSYRFPQKRSRRGFGSSQSKGAAHLSRRFFSARERARSNLGYDLVDEDPERILYCLFLYCSTAFTFGYINKLYMVLVITHYLLGCQVKGANDSEDDDEVVWSSPAFSALGESVEHFIVFTFG